MSFNDMKITYRHVLPPIQNGEVTFGAITIKGEFLIASGISQVERGDKYLTNLFTLQSTQGVIFSSANTCQTNKAGLTGTEL